MRDRCSGFEPTYTTAEAFADFATVARALEPGARHPSRAGQLVEPREASMADAEIIPIGTRGRPGRGTGRSPPVRRRAQPRRPTGEAAAATAREAAGSHAEPPTRPRPRSRPRRTPARSHREEARSREAATQPPEAVHPEGRGRPVAAGVDAARRPRTTATRLAASRSPSWLAGASGAPPGGLRRATGSAGSPSSWRSCAAGSPATTRSTSTASTPRSPSASLPRCGRSPRSGSASRSAASRTSPPRAARSWCPTTPARSRSTG